MNNESASSALSWLYDSPIYSDVEAKLRSFLVELKNANRILGVQVCVYKDGHVIIDTAAGQMGPDDRRPVQLDSLFPLFSVTKGITAGMVHWLVDKGKLKLDEKVVNIWPEFGTNGKERIKVNYILNHTSGLQNALAGIEEDPKLLRDFNECLKRIAMVAPETEPGRQQLYHYLSYGWLCGGIIEYVSKKNFQEVLDESFIHPLNIEGELYIGTPPGVESRIATLTIDPDDLSKLDPKVNPYRVPLPSSFTINTVKNSIALLNTRDGHRAIIPSANASLLARAVARYYATLVDGGIVPRLHPPNKITSYVNLKGINKLEDKNEEGEIKIFINPKEKIQDAFLGIGEYESLVLSNEIFGLGFQRYSKTDGSLIGFGHIGLGGSEAYCDINNRFAIGVTQNKLSDGSVTGEIIRFICSELDLPIPSIYA